MSEHRESPNLGDKEINQPQQVKQTFSHSSGSSVSANDGEAVPDSGAGIDALDASEHAELFLTGLLNALKHNEAAVIGGLFHSLRHGCTPQEIATHLRHNFKALQARGIMSVKRLDEVVLLTIASQSAGPQVRSITQPEGHLSNIQQNLNKSLFMSTYEPDDNIPCPYCQASSK